MLIGKWWLRPNELSLDVSTTEHALVARRVMLGLSPDEPVFTQADMFQALPSGQIHEFTSRGVSPGVLEFLSRPSDPRVYAIRKWGWIRTRRDRFYLWKLDDATLKTIRECPDYWQAQRQ